jgi:hypothetical protein
MSLRARLSRRLWLLALAGALAYTVVDAVVKVRHIEEMSRQYGVMVDAPAVDPASPTGYALGRRSMLYPNGGLDTLHWVMQTQAMLAAGEGRIRHVDYDNAPAGREVHWASPFHWWLALLAELDRAATGRPLGIAVEHAALYADPVLLGLVLLTLVPVTARRFGGTAAAFMAGGMVAAFPFYLFFATAYADHHGLAETGALMTVLFLLAGGGGVVRRADGAAPAPGGPEDFAAWLPDRRTARRWFAASAVASGVGLWISAASQVPVLVGVGLGALGAGWLTRRDEPGAAWRAEPGLWRWWGRVGAASSLAAYLIEYFPSHLGMRLEVNHPLYALAWLGGGELLCRINRAFAEGRAAFAPRTVPAWAGAVGAVLLLPAVILATGVRTFVVGDPFVWHLHVQSIAEFEHLGRFLRQEGLTWGVVADLAPAGLILPAGWLLVRRGLSRPGRALLVLALLPTLLFFGMTAAQVRWWGIAYGLLFALLAIQFTLLERPPAGRRAAVGWRLGCALFLLPGAANAVRAVAATTDLTRGDVRALVERDVAQWLRLHAGPDPVVVLSSPATTTPLIYYGGLRGLGTLYWENREGLEHAAAIFAAPSPDRAYALIRRYGVTHIVLMSWSLFTEDYVRLYLGLAPGQPLPANAFILGLLHGRGLPPWLRPLPYPLPDNPALKGQSVLVFAVTPPQTPVAMVVHLTDYLVEMGRMDLAARMEPELASYADSLPALAMLAYVQGRAGEGEAFAATVGRMLETDPAAPDLALDDRIRLAFVLAAGGHEDRARAQLATCLRGLDEPALRALTAGSLRDLLVLEQKFAMPIPDRRLQQFALGLLPPMMRPQA